MSYRGNGRGLLGLLVVAVLGVMAFAGSAQALTPQFTINGKSALHAVFTAVQEGTGSILIPNANLEINCPEFEVIEGLILSPTDADIKLLHKGCRAFSITPLEELKACHLSDVAGGKPELLHITSNSLLLPVEFADGKYGILLEKIVAIVSFLSGLGCPLPLKNVIKGEICLKITSGNDTTEPLIQSNQAIQGECPAIKLEGFGSVAKDKMLFGVNEAFIDRSAVLKLTGEHAGLTLGVLLL